MEKLFALQDRLSRVEEKFKVYMKSDEVKEKGRRSRSKKVATKLSYQMRSMKDLEERLRASSGRQASNAAPLTPQEKQTMDRLMLSNGLESEKRGGHQAQHSSLPAKSKGMPKPSQPSSRGWSDYDYSQRTDLDLPTTFNAHAFFGKRIFAKEGDSDDSVRDRARMERLRQEMDRFQANLWSGESHLTDLEAHASRARQLIIETSQGSNLNHTSAFVA